MSNTIKFIAPVIGDHFVLVPEGDAWGDNVEVIVTDVQIIPNGFTVEGLPVVRDPDDYSISARTFINV